MARKAAIGWFLLSAAIPLSPAHAQVASGEQTDPEQSTSAPSDSAGAGDSSGDIVVTAQRREQRLQDVPVSVSVVSGAALERGNVRTLQDIADRLPNVKITPGQSSNSLNIRGIGSGSNPGFEQSVATFVDGLYRPRSYAIRAALFDIDQVEVLKGPQTTFFGANAIAGALNITTRKPNRTAAFNATALYGSDNEFTLEGGYTQPLTDTLSVRIAGRAYGRDDFVRNRYLRDRGEIRELTGRIALRWQPTDSLRSELRVEGDRLRDGTAYNGELLHCPPDPAFPLAASVACTAAIARSGGRPDDRLDLRSDIIPGYGNNDYGEVGWTNTLDVGRLSFTSVTGYYDNDYRFFQDLIPVAPTGPENEPSLLVPGHDRYRQFSQELRVQSGAGEPIEFLAGLYYQRSRLFTDNYADFRFAPFIPPLGAFIPFGALFAAVAPPGTNPLGYGPTTPIAGYAQLRQRENTKSAFGAVTFRPFDGLRINAGLRFSSVTKTAHRLFQLGTHGPGPVGDDNFVPAPLVTQQVLAAVLGGDLTDFPEPRRRDNRWMPSAGIQYDVGRDLMLYGTYNRGFKAGGYGGVNLIEAFGPETVDAYELGAKGSFADRRVSFSLALFRSDYKDLQEGTIVFLPSGSTISITRNAASARSQGVELGFTARASSALTLSADLAYLDSKFRQFPAGACTVLQTLTTPNCFQDLSGKRRPFAPEFSGNVGASLKLPAGGLQVAIDPNVYFSSKYFQQSNADPLFLQKGYAKVDLRVGLGRADGGWDVSVIGKNLTDVRTAGFRSAVPASLGSVIAFPDRGRSVALQLTVRR